MKTQLRTIRFTDKTGEDGTYKALGFVCPGCRELSNGSGLHMLPVNSPHYQPSWDWNENAERPTLSPSILTQSYLGVCHSFLVDGEFQFLDDCTHSLAGQRVPMGDLPDWFTKENR